MRKALIVVVIIAGLAAGGYFLWKNRNSSSTRYRFAEIKRGDIEKVISTTGTIETKGAVEVGTQVSGRIDKIYVDFNDRVRKGQLLAVLDTSLLEAAVEDAEANLEMAKAQYELALEEYKQNKPLYEKGIISKADFLKIEVQLRQRAAQLKAAETALARAKRNLDYAYIRSPIDGIVVERNVEEGQTVAASFNAPTLFVIAADLSKVEIHALVDESDIGQIREGMPVRFTVEAYPEKVFTGRVRQIRLKAEVIQNVVNYTVIIDAENPENLLLPGMTATVDFIVEQKRDVLLVPNAALRLRPTPSMLEEVKKNMKERLAKLAERRKGSSGSFNPEKFMERLLSGRSRGRGFGRLWVLDEKGRLMVIPVRTGISDGRMTEIVGGRGIKEGMKVIIGVVESRSKKRPTMPPFRRRLF